MLKAWIRRFLSLDAPPTLPGRIPQWVTRDELDERLDAERKRSEWELNEWYEKFSTLHARLTKRVQRASHSDGAAVAASPNEPEGERSRDTRPLPSALTYRKPWSV